MRTDDIFEAMTDIDDRFIEAARPIEQYDGFQPVVIRPAPRRALWKTAIPAAAFVAVVAAAGVFGVKYLRGRIEIAPPAASISNSIASDYPEEAKFIVDSDVKSLIWGYPSGSPSWFDDHVDYANSYEELAKRSDIIVSGTFIDDIHQLQDSNKIVVADDECAMYNKLEIDSVIKGDLSRGEVIIIHQDSSINASNGEGKLIFVLDQLSPMFKGDKWVYFLKLEDDGTFTPVNGPQGRYPLPNSTNRLVTSDGINPNVDEYFTYENDAPARDEIYEELLKKLSDVEIKVPGLERIEIPETSFTTFEMPEFPFAKFNVSKLGVSANIEEILEITDIFKMKDGETLENLYLADLNGDGKRELCVTISGEKKRVEVRDYGNDARYAVSGEDDYFLADEDGVLMLYYTKRERPDTAAADHQELTLDLLIPVGASLPLWEVPLLGNATFTLPDFEGIEFETDVNSKRKRFIMYWGEHRFAWSGPVNEVYVCDLDGDGQREIITNSLFVDDGCIHVYGFMNSGELGEVKYIENGGCRVVETDGTLKYKAANSGMKDINYSKSDLKRVFTDRRSMWGGTPFGLGDPGDYGYYEFVPDDEHSVTSLNDLSPSDDNYSISIENGTLSVSRGSETLLKTGKLEELYGVTDAEKNCLLFVYRSESGGIDAFILTENNSSKLVHIDDIVDNNVVLTDHRDVSIDFKDGRGVSLIGILSRIYK
ncbi:MAG: hypothetical protein K2J77_05265 [Oscillospiraceae bacterium]|nr:hypothetical protein [Oscillospiraceae bacterium]